MSRKKPVRSVAKSWSGSSWFSGLLSKIEKSFLTLFLILPRLSGSPSFLTSAWSSKRSRHWNPSPAQILILPRDLREPGREQGDGIWGLEKGEGDKNCRHWGRGVRDSRDGADQQLLLYLQVDPTTHLTFNLHLSKKEREAKDSLTLPFQFSSEK